MLGWLLLWLLLFGTTNLRVERGIYVLHSIWEMLLHILHTSWSDCNSVIYCGWIVVVAWRVWSIFVERNKMSFFTLRWWESCPKVLNLLVSCNMVPMPYVACVLVFALECKGLSTRVQRLFHPGAKTFSPRWNAINEFASHLSRLSVVWSRGKWLKNSDMWLCEECEGLFPYSV